MPLHVLRANGLLHRATADGQQEDRGEHKRQKPPTRQTQQQHGKLTHLTNVRRRLASGQPASSSSSPSTTSSSTSSALFRSMGGHVQANGVLTQSLTRGHLVHSNSPETTACTVSLNPLAVAVAVTAAAINSAGRRKAEEAAWKLLPGVGGRSRHGHAPGRQKTVKRRHPPARARASPHRNDRIPRNAKIRRRARPPTGGGGKGRDSFRLFRPPPRLPLSFGADVRLQKGRGILSAAKRQAGAEARSYHQLASCVRMGMAMAAPVPVLREGVGGCGVGDGLGSHGAHREAGRRGAWLDWRSFQEAEDRWSWP